MESAVDTRKEELNSELSREKLIGQNRSSSSTDLQRKEFT